MLSLVFVEPLDLDIKECIGIHHDARLAADQVGQSALVLSFNLAPVLSKSVILRQGLELAQLIEVVDPAGPDVVGDQFSQGRVAEHQEAAGGDPVGHIDELFR